MGVTTAEKIESKGSVDPFVSQEENSSYLKKIHPHQKLVKFKQRKQIQATLVCFAQTYILFGGFSYKLNVTVTNGPKPYYIFLHYQKRKMNGSTNTFGEIDVSLLE